MMSTRISRRRLMAGGGLLAVTGLAGCLPQDQGVTIAPVPPTPVAGGAQLPTIAVKASSQRLRVGDDLTLSATSTRLGKPVFTVTNGNAAISVRQDQSLPAGQPFGESLRLQEARARGEEAVFVLRATAKGTISLVVLASGEAEKQQVTTGPTPLPFQTVTSPGIPIVIE